MKTITPDGEVGTVRNWVFYDGECGWCMNVAARFEPVLHRHRFGLAPLQTTWVRQRAGLNPGEPLTEMKLLAENNQIYDGADALLHIARMIWWAWPLYAISFLPGIKTFLRAFYRWFAARRNCVGGKCSISKNLD